MKSHVSFITTPTGDTEGTTLMLHFDDKRYLIGNFAEGTQRALGESRIKLMKVRELFATGKTEWRSVGGLIGLMLTLADAQAASMAEHERQPKKNGHENDAPPEKPRLSVFGAPNLNYQVATCRRFVFRQGMPIDCQEFWEDKPPGEDGFRAPDFSDSLTRVWGFPIMPDDAQDSRPTGMISPRKRSHDELEDNEATAEPEENPEQKFRRYADMARSVVGEMFNSNWRFDTLVETNLSKVNLPATIFIRNHETKTTEKYTGPNPNPDDPLVLVRTPWPGANFQALPPTKPKPQAVSYLIRNQPIRGKFLAKKAAELGVPSGKERGLLARGMSVQLPNGRVIEPEDVLGPERQGAGFVVADLPSHEYVKPFVDRVEWVSEAMMDGVGMFIWILGPGVSANPALRHFMEEHSHLQHFVSSKDHCPNKLAMETAAAATAQLGAVDPKRYGRLVHDNETIPQNSLGLNSAAVPLPACAKPALPGQIIHLGPTFGPNSCERSLLDVDKVAQGVWSEVRALADAARQSIEEARPQLDKWRRRVPCPDAEIFTLGTGSALPSKYRNVSATLVRVPGYGNYLLDAGENTLGQLQRVFPPDELANVFRDLRMIWISHMHADHHLGTVSVIKAWYQHVHASIPLPPTSPQTTPAYWSLVDPSSSTDRKLAVVADVAMTNWLAEYANVEDYGYSRLLPLVVQPSRHNSSTLNWVAPPTIFSVDTETNPLTIEVPRSRYEELFGLQDIQSVYVSHCANSRAVSLTFPDSTCINPPTQSNLKPLPFKVSYSGDCRPSKDFALIGKNSTVLIHEATFEDELRKDAIAKKHSTTSEALEIGAMMRVKCALLTHFSQRYQRMPVIERAEDEEIAEESSEDEMEVDDVDTNAEAAVEKEEEDVAPADDATTMAEVAGAADIEPQSMFEDPFEAALGLVNVTPPEPPKFDTTSKTKGTVKASSNMRIGVAFDYMRVKVGEFAELEFFWKAVNKMLDMSEEERAKENEVISESYWKWREKKGLEGKPMEKVKDVGENVEGGKMVVKDDVVKKEGEKMEVAKEGGEKMEGEKMEGEKQ